MSACDDDPERHNLHVAFKLLVVTHRQELLQDLIGWRGSVGVVQVDVSDAGREEGSAVVV